MKRVTINKILVEDIKTTITIKKLKRFFNKNSTVDKPNIFAKKIDLHTYDLKI